MDIVTGWQIVEWLEIAANAALRLEASGGRFRPVIAGVLINQASFCPGFGGVLPLRTFRSFAERAPGLCSFGTKGWESGFEPDSGVFRSVGLFRAAG